MPMGTVVGPPKRVSAADRDDDERNRRGLRADTLKVKRTALRRLDYCTYVEFTCSDVEIC